MGIFQDLQIFVYDWECFKHDWLVVLKRFGEDDYYVFHNDSATLNGFFDAHPDAVLVGFNNKHYDKYIQQAALQGRSPSEVHEVNDWIIGGRNGWDHPFFQSKSRFIPQFDIRDDMQDNISLKMIEGHLGMDIEETEVDFNLDRPLTHDELELTANYCKHDVDATEEIVKLREGYLQAKVDLGAIAGLNAVKALSMTNATLTATFLQAEKKTFTDEREYLFPDTVKWEYIPDVVKEFFNRGKDKSIPDSDVFSGTCEFEITGCPVTVAWGGIHAAIPKCHVKATEDRVIRNWDVASLYPSLMIQYGYTSRAIPDPKMFRDVYNTRIKAKHSGDKKTANTLKLVLNTTYGAMLLPGGLLYDGKMGRSVCVGGQLLILELAEHICHDFPSVRVLQLNTDGIMIECDKSDLVGINKLIEESQERTRLSYEEDAISEIWQKDVNNYVMRFEDGHYKTKGAYFKEGVSTAGAFSINNDFNIVKKAIFEYFANGVEPEVTIANCNDLSQFQLIARGGSKYSHVTHVVGDTEETVQKCNRVYAAKDQRLGILYKWHKETGRKSKIANCPDHCIINNDGHSVTIDQVDKRWYVMMAKKRISDFYPKKGKVKQMEDNKQEVEVVEVHPVDVGMYVNPIPEKMDEVPEDPKCIEERPPVFTHVYAKLAKARRMLIDTGIKPSGKNMHMKYQYFELKDFVPQVTRIFDEIGLLSMFRTFGSLATLQIIDTEHPEEMVDFDIPYVAAETNNGVQPIQALGSTITYLRRYLYQVALDLAESDGVDAETVEESTTVPVAPAKPASPVKREEAIQQLTAPADGANPSADDVAKLKAAMLILRDKKGESVENYLQQIAMETKGFTSFTHEQKEAYIIELSKRMGD